MRPIRRGFVSSMLQCESYTIFHRLQWHHITNMLPWKLNNAFCTEPAPSLIRIGRTFFLPFVSIKLYIRRAFLFRSFSNRQRIHLGTVVTNMCRSSLKFWVYNPRRPICTVERDAMRFVLFVIPSVKLCTVGKTTWNM